MFNLSCAVEPRGSEVVDDQPAGLRRGQSIVQAALWFTRAWESCWLCEGLSSRWHGPCPARAQTAKTSWAQGKRSATWRASADALQVAAIAKTGQAPTTRAELFIVLEQQSFCPKAPETTISIKSHAPLAISAASAGWHKKKSKVAEVSLRLARAWGALPEHVSPHGLWGQLMFLSPCVREMQRQVLLSLRLWIQSWPSSPPRLAYWIGMDGHKRQARWALGAQLVSHCSVIHQHA